MKIKKTNEKITYLKKTTEHSFEVEGKEVRVYEHYIDSADGEYDADQEINEKDLATLTDEEREVFGEDLQAWLDLKVGEDTIVEN